MEASFQKEELVDLDELRETAGTAIDVAEGVINN